MTHPSLNSPSPLKKDKSGGNCAGFTLVELMVVIAIFAILSGAAALSLASARLRAVGLATDEMIGDFQQARILAVKDNQNCTITFNMATNQYTVTSANKIKTINLSKFHGVRLANSPNGADPAPVGAIIFTTRGLAQAAVNNINIYLTNQDNSRFYRIQTTLAGTPRALIWDAPTGTWH